MNLDEWFEKNDILPDDEDADQEVIKYLRLAYSEGYVQGQIDAGNKILL